MSEETGHAGAEQMWGAILGVSSFLYRITEQAPPRDALRWHLQDLAVRLLRSAAKDFFVEPENAVRYHGDRPMAAAGGFMETRAALRQLLSVMELLRERSWVDGDAYRSLTKHVWYLRSRLAERTAQDRPVTSPSEVSRATPASHRTMAGRANGVTVRKNGRQGKILSMIQERGSLPVSASLFSPAFPGITARTIRRDLQLLVRQGLLAQDGRGRGARYRLRH